MLERTGEAIPPCGTPLSVAPQVQSSRYPAVNMLRSSRRKRRHTTRFEDLTAALRLWAKGLFSIEAAVELLIGHRSWLYREDFGELAVEFDREMVNGSVLAAVDWAAAVAALDAGQLPCSRSEGQVLRLAASIAGGVPVDL